VALSQHELEREHQRERFADYTRVVPSGDSARRLTWPFLPRPLREYVESRIGGTVVDARSVDSGFTPGFASILTTDSGERVFLKAANRKAQAGVAAAYAEEARRHTQLAGLVPAPELLWWQPPRGEDGWVLLCFEAYDGRAPRRPWQLGELNRALDLAEEIADRTRILPDDLDLSPLVDEVPDLLTSWGRVAAVFPEREHLEEADALARSFADLRDRSFAHCDLRDDNILLGDTGAVACDWNWPALAPAWIDLVFLLASAYGDGLDVDPLLAERRLTRDVPADAIDAWLAACCGYMTVAAGRPARNSSPFLPRHAGWYADVLWGWLSDRRDW